MRRDSSPFPLLSAIAAKTSRIEIGTAVIDMRYEHPLNARILGTIAKHIAPAIGWTPAKTVTAI